MTKVEDARCFTCEHWRRNHDCATTSLTIEKLYDTGFCSRWSIETPHTHGCKTWSARKTVGAGMFTKEERKEFEVLRAKCKMQSDLISRLRTQLFAFSNSDNEHIFLIRVRQLGAEDMYQWKAEIEQTEFAYREIVDSCVAYGSTVEMAMMHLGAALENYMSVMLEDGEELKL